MSQASRSARFVRNVGASVFGQLALMFISFFLTPRLIHALGVEAYGLYILFQAAIGYISLFCLGAGSAGLRFVAEKAATGGRGLRQAVQYCLSLHLAGSLVGALALAWLAPWCARELFHVQAGLLAPAVFVLRCAAVAAVFYSLNQCFSSILAGLQRFDWQNAALFTLNGLLLIGATALALKGFGINGVARWYVLWNVCALAVPLVAAWRLLRPRWHGAGGELSFRKFLAFGLSLWSGQFAWLVTYQFDRLFIARVENLSALTLYSVPANLLQRLQFFPSVVSTVMLPMFSEIAASDDETVRRVYLRGMRFLLFVLLPALALLFCLMPQFLGLWLGGDFSSVSVWPARLLVMAQAVVLLNYVPNAVVSGRGQPLHQSAVSWAQAVISLVAWTLLIGRYRLLGVALGSLLAQALPTGFYLAATHRGLLRLSWSRFVNESLVRPFLCAALLLAVVFPFHQLATSWPRLFGLAAAGLAVYAACGWLAMDPGDKDLFVRLVLRRS